MAKRDESTDLSRELVALRQAAPSKTTQLAAARAVGITQSQMSRIESGPSLPTDEQAHALLELYAAASDGRAKVERLLAAARSGVQDTRLVVQRGGTLAMQRRWRALLDGSSLVRAYQPAMVLGELQTPEYAAVAVGHPVGSREVAARLGQAAADAPARRHVLIQSEGSLLVPVGSAATMRGQLDAIVEASRLPNVEFGVLTSAHPLQSPTPVGFNLYDEHTAVVSLKVAAAPLTGEADVASFRALFDRLAEAAVFGDQARAVVRRIARRYR